MAEKGDDDGETDGRFGRGHGHHEEGDDLPVDRAELRGRRRRT